MTPEFTVPCPKCGELQDDEMRAELIFRDGPQGGSYVVGFSWRCKSCHCKVGPLIVGSKPLNADGWEWFHE